MDRVITYCINTVGALASSPVYTFKAPCDLQITHFSLENSSANAGTFKLGNDSDDDAYLAAEAFGVSGTPTEVSTPAGFDGATANGQFPHIAKGTIIKATVTDHGSHMADVIVVITATEG